MARPKIKVVCAHREGGVRCSESYLSGNRWDDLAAHREGWFMMQNGDAFCPSHVPDWVDGWRARRDAQAAEGGAEPLAEAIKTALQEEADSLGCGGSELGVFLSEMLDRIGVRVNHLMGDEGH